MIFATRYASPIGSLTLAGDGKRLLGLWMDGQKYFGGTVAESWSESTGVRPFDETKRWLDRYFAGRNPSIDQLPLAPRGGEFRRGVWRILRGIPYGRVITYGQIAQQMAAKAGKARMSGQAVGGAVGRNPISVIIPCHRVVGANGSLTGYSGGMAKKIKLLELEGVDMRNLFVPKKGTAL